MTVSLDQAAADLLRQIAAPPGAVNTLGTIVKRKKTIRVLVDASYWYRIKSVPKTYKGYAVQIEKRGPIEIGSGFRLSIH
jgi:hypothetical protein